MIFSQFPELLFIATLFIINSPEVGTSQMPINKQTDK